MDKEIVREIVLIAKRIDPNFGLLVRLSSRVNADALSKLGDADWLGAKKILTQTINERFHMNIERWGEIGEMEKREFKVSADILRKKLRHQVNT